MSISYDSTFQSASGNDDADLVATLDTPLEMQPHGLRLKLIYEPVAYEVYYDVRVQWSLNGAAEHELVFRGESAVQQANTFLKVLRANPEAETRKADARERMFASGFLGHAREQVYKGRHRRPVKDGGHER